MKGKISVAIAIGLLIATLITSGWICRPLLTIASGSPTETDIDTNLEYSNGTIESLQKDLKLWYAWINTSSTQIIYLAYQSHVVNPPVITFLGQHYRIENDTEVFVGNTLSLMEVYNDTNGNGVPDADFVAGVSEIVYYFLVNSSIGFVITPIQKSLIDGLPHYTWGIRYDTIDGFLVFEDQSPAAMVMLDYMAFSFDFYILNNVSYLKTNFGIGKPLRIAPLSEANVTLDGLSLALLYSTTVITSKPYLTLADGNPYNSTTAPTMVEPTQLGEIKIEDVKAYQFLFGQNYTLFRDLQQEIYESESVAVANRSVSNSLRVSIEWLLSNLENVLSDIFPKISKIQATINLDVAVSPFLYRICYPKWDGCRLEHDPTYVAYLKVAGMSGITPPPITEITPPLAFVIAAALLGLIALTISLIDLKKTRKMLRYPIQSPVTTFS